jgi:predicted O-methyltransferase YrrM
LDRAGKVLKEIEEMTDREFLPIVGPEKGEILANIVRETKPKHVLEVGTRIGYSAILIGKELDDDAQLVTIEIHADEAKLARQNIERAGIRAKTEVLVGNALKIIPELEGKFDIVFIDAEKTEYLQYLKLVEEKLHSGSVIVADNAGVFADQMKGYLDRVRSSKMYHSRFVEVGDDGLEISTRL